MKKFEYKSVKPSFLTKDDLDKWLNEQGANGWELAMSNYGYFIFKRAIN